jgi:hypothetical protein
MMRQVLGICSMREGTGTDRIPSVKFLSLDLVLKFSASHGGDGGRSREGSFGRGQKRGAFCCVVSTSEPTPSRNQIEIRLREFGPKAACCFVFDSLVSGILESFVASFRSFADRADHMKSCVTPHSSRAPTPQLRQLPPHVPAFP